MSSGHLDLLRTIHECKWIAATWTFEMCDFYSIILINQMEGQIFILLNIFILVKTNQKFYESPKDNRHAIADKI